METNTGLTLVRSFASGGVRGSVYCGEALDFLSNVETGTAGVVFLDPPFNLGKRYAPGSPRLDRRPEGEYEQWLHAVLDESARILVDGGALYLYHLPRWAMRFGSHLDGVLDFRHWIAVAMKNGFARGKRLYPAHYALLMFTKGEPAHFSRPKLAPTTCRHCGKYTKDYGGYRSIIEEKGVNLSDIWEDLSPVRHARHKNRVANELPITLFERVFAISGQPGMLYVDPFAGSGSGAVCAVRAGMAFKCCDVVRETCELICSRLSAAPTHEGSTPPDEPAVRQGVPEEALLR